MNEHWHRWVFASVAKHFSDVAAARTPALATFVEGAPRGTQELEDWVEIRQDGPDWSGGTQNEWNAKLEVNLFIISKMNMKDNYRIHRNIGAMLAAAVQIPVLKLGPDAVIDDGSFITCLMLNATVKAPLVVSQLGQVDPTTQLVRATIDGSYLGNFYG